MIYIEHIFTIYSLASQRLLSLILLCAAGPPVFILCLYTVPLEGFPSVFALGKSLEAALPALGKPRPSLLFYLD